MHSKAGHRRAHTPEAEAKYEQARHSPVSSHQAEELRDSSAAEAERDSWMSSCGWHVSITFNHSCGMRFHPGIEPMPRLLVVQMMYSLALDNLLTLITVGEKQAEQFQMDNETIVNDAYFLCRCDQLGSLVRGWMKQQ